jgi:hypothetical protein
MADSTNNSLGTTDAAGSTGSANNAQVNLGPFDRLLDIEGVDGPEDIFGGVGGFGGGQPGGGGFGGGQPGGGSGGGQPDGGGGNMPSVSPFVQLEQNLNEYFQPFSEGGIPDASQFGDPSEINPFANGFGGGSPSADSGDNESNDGGSVIPQSVSDNGNSVTDESVFPEVSADFLQQAQSQIESFGEIFNNFATDGTSATGDSGQPLAPVVSFLNEVYGENSPFLNGTGDDSPIANGSNVFPQLSSEFLTQAQAQIANFTEIFSQFEGVSNPFASGSNLFTGGNDPFAVGENPSLGSENLFASGSNPLAGTGN